MVSKIAIEEYRELYLNRYGIMLSYKQAEVQATNLLGLYRNTLKPTAKIGSDVQNNIKK